MESGLSRAAEGPLSLKVGVPTGFVDVYPRDEADQAWQIAFGDWT
jgi:hypothetical protein